MNQAAQIARLEEQLEEARYQIRLLKGGPQPFDLMGKLGLTKTEAHIVQVIMQRSRATKDAIYQVVYGDRNPDEIPGDNLLAVLMTRIRKRLRQHDVEIQTIWGVGYAMTPENVSRLRAVLKHTTPRPSEPLAQLLKETV